MYIWVKKPKTTTNPPKKTTTRASWSDRIVVSLSVGLFSLGSYYSRSVSLYFPFRPVSFLTVVGCSLHYVISVLVVSFTFCWLACVILSLSLSLSLSVFLSASLSVSFCLSVSLSLSRAIYRSIIVLIWLVCRVTENWIEVCFQSWYNPSWLTGLKTPVNQLTNSMFHSTLSFFLWGGGGGWAVSYTHLTLPTRRTV